MNLLETIILNNCNMHCKHCCNLPFAKKDCEMTLKDLSNVARQADELALSGLIYQGAAASIKKFLPKISICTYHLEEIKRY